MVFQQILRALIICILLPAVGFNCHGQDKIYTSDGKIITGKVVQITPYQIHYYVKYGLDSVLYVINQKTVDSIIFFNGATNVLPGFRKRRKAHENIPQLNTWSFDVCGFIYSSISQSYERRLKNGKVGFRIPLYIAYAGGGVAGTGIFIRGSGDGAYFPAEGRYLDYGNQPTSTYGGFSIATGINPKVYLFKNRYVRAYVGPEFTIGYSTATSQYSAEYSTNGFIPAYKMTEADGTFASIAKFGFMFFPIDKLSMCLEGGVGAVCMFGSPTPLGWAGGWHFGFALGTNF